MVLKECVESKYAAQKKHFRQMRGSFSAYSKLIAKKYPETMKRRAKK